MVLLENPRSHGNIGAAVRVAAAVGAAGVVTTGDHDPWHPSALVGSAGLHFRRPSRLGFQGLDVAAASTGTGEKEAGGGGS